MSNDTLSQYNNAKYDIPIVFGITGHRDIKEEYIGLIKQKVQDIFINFKNKYPNTPIYLLTPLAEGADRIVAQVFLQLKESPFNISGELIAVLPMDKNEYIKDFTTLNSLKEFELLYSHSDETINLPYLNENKDGNITRRDLQYEQVGEFISRKSQVLIALWDGINNDLVGGTSAVVKHKLSGSGLTQNYLPINENLLNPEDTGPVYHIYTPRKNSSLNNGAPNNSTVPIEITLTKKYPECVDDCEETEEYYRNIYEQIESYNKDLYKNNDLIKNKIKTSIKHIISQKNYNGMSSNFKNTIIRYGAADVLAQKYQKIYKRHLLLMFILGFITVTSFLFYDEIWRNYIFLAIYLVCLGISGLVYYIIGRNNIQMRYLDYRALAEGLRVQFFWKYAGIDKDVADYYLQKQKSELEWIRCGIRMSCLYPVNTINTTQIDEKQTYQFIYDYWIVAQKEYFDKKVIHDKEYLQLKKDEKKVSLLFYINIIIMVITLIYAIIKHPNDINAYLLTIKFVDISLDFDNLIMFTTGFIILLMSVLEGFHLKNGVLQNVRQYKKMLSFYRLAAKKMFMFSSENNTEKIEKLIFTIGKEALSENADWFLMHREQKMDIFM